MTHMIRYLTDNITITAYGTEEVQFGSVKASSQALAIASNATARAVWSAPEMDGIMGLTTPWRGPLSSAVPDITFAQSLASSLALPIFAVEFHRNGIGSLVFGSFDMAAFKGKLATAHIVDGAGWTVALPRFAIGDGPLQPVTTDGTVFLDTGDSRLVLSEEIVRNYYGAVPGAQQIYGTFFTPCTATLPDLHLNLAPDYLARIPGALIRGDGAGENGICPGVLQKHGDGAGQVFGHPFFYAQYVVFNTQDLTVSFAEHARLDG